MSNLSDFIIENGVLKRYKGSGGDVVIPEGVTRVGDWAFRDCRSLASVTIPDGVTSIGDHAFKDCKSLASVTIPESVTSIGDVAFRGCRGLADADGFVIVKGGLYDYKGPGGDVTIPVNVRHIDDWVFYSCHSLTSVVIPGSVTSIGDSAFDSCENLASVEIRSGVTSIGDSAFDGCESLASVTIPDSVTTIGRSVFSSCRSLTSVKIGASVTDIGGFAFNGCISLRSVEIPGSVTSIGDSAFQGCRSLTSVEIPESVTSIGNAAFRGCRSLTSVEIPESVTSIGDSAFYECGNLTSVEIGPSVTSIGIAAFYQCENLTSVTIPDSVTSIGKEAFSHCESLTSVTIPGNVMSISNWAFCICSNLRNVTIPEGVTSIGDHAFYLCKSLMSVELPASVKRIDNDAFSGCERLMRVELPAGVKSIGNRTFSGCKSLRSVTIPGSVKSIGDEAYCGCESLTSVTIPEGVTSIGNSAFSGCKGLEELQILGQPRIGREAFRDCVALKTLSITRPLDPKALALAGLCATFREEEMLELIAQVKTWSKQDRETFFASYLTSDTRAAMLLAEKRKELDKYAALRGMDTDELRDRYLSDLGLDALGRKSYDLGNAVVSIRMSPDLSFAVELPEGKTAKSLPKKGADPAKFDAANKDFAQIKKDAKKIWKNRADLLLGDFISGRERTAAYWQKTYGGNPILHRVACLLVWQQGKSCFLRTDEGLVTADGGAYELTAEKIRLAHPMELEAEELAAWQRYFTAHGLKQPFAQIWERAYAPEEIAPDRYAGCPILFFQLQGAGKHGFDHELKIPGCKIDAKWNSETAPNGNQVSYCDIRSFRIMTFSRAVNHALAYLDRVTILGRIQKDDADVMKSVEGCNLAQVTDYIAAAQEAQAVNVLALLLEYKNAHFADFDPMDEFTLEW